MRLRIFISTLLATALLVGCKKDAPELGEAPTAADAEFTYTPSSETPNILNFTATNASEQIMVWNFGNGTGGVGKTAKGVFPLKGDYTVQLTVFQRGGSVTSSKVITIMEDDLSLLNSPNIVNLTGGIDGKGYKTWVMDSSRDGHFGVGPNPSSALGNIPEYYSAEPFQQAAMDMYNDRYKFYLNEFKFDMITQGKAFSDNLAKDEFSSSIPTSGEDFQVVLEDQLDENWNLLTEDGITYLTVTGKTFLGFYAGTRKYQILKLSENELSLRYVDANAPELAWYVRFVPDGFAGVEDTTDNGGGNTDTLPKYTLPIDFETVQPDWEQIENQTDSIVANPDSSAVNPSDSVLLTEKGPIDWSGLYIDMKDAFDFSTKKSIALKVYAPKTGKFLIKIENNKNSGQFQEIEVNVTKTNEWEEISADFSSIATPGIYNRLVLIPAWKDPNAGTFYIDDIEQK